MTRGGSDGSRRQTRPHPALVKPPGRNVPARTRLFLYVRAGGRCQFDGCNRYLLEHSLTKKEGNFAQMAHIWAFADRGPRGGRRDPKQSMHAVSNLMVTVHALERDSMLRGGRQE